MATIRWWTGRLEDLPDDEARAAVDGGHAWLVTAYETAMIDPPREVAMVQPAKAKHGRPRKRRGS